MANGKVLHFVLHVGFCFSSQQFSAFTVWFAQNEQINLNKTGE